MERAERDPKHRMALVFRWYLGQAAHWAKDGAAARTIDYQVWCGPAMGAFNEWVAGSFLEAPEQRTVATVALNILYRRGACSPAPTCFVARASDCPRRLHAYEPLEDTQIKEYLA